MGNKSSIPEPQSVPLTAPMTSSTLNNSNSTSMQDNANNNNINISVTEPKIQMGEKMSSHLHALRNRTLHSYKESPSVSTKAPMTSDKSDTIRSIVLAENEQYKTININGSNNILPLPLPLTVDKTRSIDNIHQSMNF
eukprot:171917_1